jgi:hypothetical protein
MNRRHSQRSSQAPPAAENQNQAVLRGVQISESSAFVADITPIACSEAGKPLPNPNVLIELGWAMQAPGYERIVSVFNAAEGWTPEGLSFDIRHRRPMQYNLAADASPRDVRKAKKRLVRQLSDAIRLIIGESVEAEAEEARLPKVQANQDDPSIWATAGEVIEHTDSLGVNQASHVHLAPPPRAFIRVIPSGWKTGIPSVHEIERLGNSIRPSPAPEGGVSGNHGPFEDGFVSWTPAKTYRSRFRCDSLR